jgi:hypothetical protein
MEDEEIGPWMGRDGRLQTGAAVVSGLSDAMNAYVGLEQLDLAKDQFEFNKQLANRNLANQGLSYNTALEDRTKIGSALGGQTAEQSQARLNALANKKMNTAEIVV